MGNDGGSIPKRRELVKESARNPTSSELRATTLESLAHAWRTCALSGETLKLPVVSDALGRLFNKEEIIKAILPNGDAEDEDVNRQEKEECLRKADIKGLKDVIEVKFECQKSERKGDPEKWICPITQKELGENTKALYLVPCGHAFAEAVVKEIDDNRCPQCAEPHAPNDAISIIPTDEVEFARLTLRMRTLKEQGLTHTLKKAKKGKKAADLTEQAQRDAQQKFKHGIQTNSIQNAATASLTAKVLEEQERRNRKRKAAQNENLESLFAKDAAVSAKKGKNNDFMNRGFSIPANQR